MAHREPLADGVVEGPSWPPEVDHAATGGWSPDQRAVRESPSPTTGWSADQHLRQLVAGALLGGGADAAGMPDPRTSTALRQLTDLGRELEPSRWSWAVRTYEPGGRIRLPADARAAIGFRPGTPCEVSGRCQRVGLVIGHDRPGGARLTVDPWGRLMLPAWLRRGAERALLIGSDIEASVLVVAPASVLDSVGELLVGGRS